MRVSVITFGCTVNNYESQEIMRKFTQNGDIIVEQGESDVIIFNSCVITGVAEKGVLQLIERRRKKHPDALIIMTGCYNEYIKKEKPDNAAGNVTRYTTGNGFILVDKKRDDFVDEIHRLYDMYSASGDTAQAREVAVLAGNCSSQPDGGVAQTKTGAVYIDPAIGGEPAKFRTARALIQVQTGCSNYCSFCIVPHVRGASVSTPYDEIEAKIHEYSTDGCREFLFAGLNLGSYDCGGLSLIDVIEKVDAMQNVGRIRLSSLEPMNISDAFIDRLPNIAKLAPHLHISMQCGCSATLHRMNRRHSYEEFEQLINRIRAAIPGIAISTDIIVGFPGESDRDFDESIENIVKCRFSDIHIFKYSQRKGTAAAAMNGQISEHKKNSRALQLKGVKQQSRYDFYSGYIAETDYVTLLRCSGENGWEGVTSHNFPVFIHDDKSVDSISGIAILDEGKPTDGGIIPVRITGMHTSQEAYIGEFA